MPEVNCSDIAPLTECYSVLYSLLKLYEIVDEKDQKDYQLDEERTVKTWAEWSSTTNWVKFMKFHLASFVAYHLDNQVPINKDYKNYNPKYLIPGAIGRKLLSYLKFNQSNGKAISLLQSILQSKKGMPRPSKDFLEKSLDDTFTTLTNDQLQNWSRFERVGLHQNYQDILENLTRTVEEIFNGRSFETEDLYKMYFPSTSANYINSRSKLGAVKDVKDAMGVEFISIPIQVSDDLDKDSRVNNKINSTKELQNVFNVPVLDFRQLRLQYNILFDNLVQQSLYEANKVKMVALSEPLKVRVITKGPPLRQTIGKTVQKFMHSVMRKTKTFCLIGQPVTKELLNTNLSDSKYYLSGDYSDATNQIHPDFSNYTFKEIVRVSKMNPAVATICESLLTEHIIVHKGESAKQKWGQLMGSIVSFPILCIINAALSRMAIEECKFDELQNQCIYLDNQLYRVKILTDDLGYINLSHSPKIREQLVCAYREWKRSNRWKTLKFLEMNNFKFQLFKVTAEELKVKATYNLNRCRMLINGDDILIGTDSKNLYQYWNDYLSLAGLKNSIGKTYFSSKFANVNSTFFVKNETSKQFEMVNYVNTGLLFNKSRSSTSPTSSSSGKNNTALSAALELVDRINDGFYLCPKELQDTFLNYALKLHGDRLKQLAPGVPWFMKNELGGLGIVTNGQHQPSNLDLKLSLGALIDSKRTKKSIPNIRNIAGGGWMIRSESLADLKEAGVEFYYTEDVDAVENTEKLMHNMAMYTLFTRPFKQLYQHVKTREKQFLKQVNKIYSPKKGRIYKEELPIQIATTSEKLQECCNCIFIDYFIEDDKFYEKLELCMGKPQDLLSLKEQCENIREQNTIGCTLINSVQPVSLPTENKNL